MSDTHYYDYLVQQPLRTVALLAASLAVYITYTFVSDYRRWIVFTQGNPPKCNNITGYLVFAWHAFHLWAVRDPGPRSTKYIRCDPPTKSYLDLTKTRSGPRPTLVPWLLPQREAGPYLIEQTWRERVNQIIKEVVDKINAEVSKESPSVQWELSRLEGCNPAVIIADSVTRVCADVSLVLREVAHVHGQDASLHIIISPADAIKVIELGWGERFGLAGRKCLIGNLAGCVAPKGWVFAYHPRDEKEVAVVKSIIKAGVMYALDG